MFHTTGGQKPGGFALWQYTAGAWVLKKDACDKGYEPGGPPRGPGRYEGEIRKTAGVPRPEKGPPPR
jgi:hypothetical protein